MAQGPLKCIGSHNKWFCLLLELKTIVIYTAHVTFEDFFENDRPKHQMQMNIRIAIISPNTEYVLLYTQIYLNEKTVKCISATIIMYATAYHSISFGHTYALHCLVESVVVSL